MFKNANSLIKNNIVQKRLQGNIRTYQILQKKRFFLNAGQSQISDLKLKEEQIQIV